MVRPYKHSRKTFKRKAPGKVQVKDVKKDVQKLKIWHKLEKPEVTELQRTGVVSGSNNVTSAATNHQLTALSSTYRRGKEITLKSVRYRGYLRWTTGTSGGLVTLTFVKSNDQTSDTYLSISNSYTAGDTNYGFPIEGLSKKFTILKTMRFQQNTTIQEIPLDFYVPVQYIRTRYNGDLGTDIEKNGVYMFIQSNTSANHPTLALNENLRYYDN